MATQKRKREGDEASFSDEELPEPQLSDGMEEMPGESAEPAPPAAIQFPCGPREANKTKWRKGPPCVRCEQPGMYCGSTPWARCCRKIIEAAKSNAIKFGWKDLFDSEKAKGGEAFRRLLRDFEAGCPPGPGGRRQAFDHSQYREKYYSKTEVVRGHREELLDYKGWMEWRKPQVGEDKAHAEWLVLEKNPGASEYDFEMEPTLAFWVKTGRKYRDTLFIKGQETLDRCS